MTERRWPRLEAAEDAYLDRFGEIPPIGPYLDHRRLPDVLQEAVECGEKLTDATLAERLGVPARAAPPSSTVEDP